MKLWIPFALAIVIMIGAGYLQGTMTERWGEFPELDLFAKRIDNVPLHIGEWEGSVMEQIDQRVMNIAKFVKSLNISYKNRNTKDVVTVNIVCGRMVDVFSHTPDRCYPAHGFSTVDDPQPALITFGPQDAFSANFMNAKFLKSDRKGSTPIRIFWIFSSDGTWDAPSNPRMTFAGQHALYKLYIQHVDIGDGKQQTVPIGKEFAKALLPELTKAFFPGSKSEVALREAAEKAATDEADAAESGK